MKVYHKKGDKKVKSWLGKKLSLDVKNRNLDSFEDLKLQT